VAQHQAGKKKQRHAQDRCQAGGRHRVNQHTDPHRSRKPRGSHDAARHEEQGVSGGEDSEPAQAAGRPDGLIEQLVVDDRVDRQDGR
jgi:hypothetical protein